MFDCIRNFYAQWDSVAPTTRHLAHPRAFRAKLADAMVPSFLFNADQPQTPSQAIRPESRSIAAHAAAWPPSIHRIVPVQPPWARSCGAVLVAALAIVDDFMTRGVLVCVCVVIDARTVPSRWPREIRCIQSVSTLVTIGS